MQSLERFWERSTGENPADASVRKSELETFRFALIFARSRFVRNLVRPPLVLRELSRAILRTHGGNPVRVLQSHVYSPT